jgi:hypothetical protein
MAVLQEMSVAGRTYGFFEIATRDEKREKRKQMTLILLLLFAFSVHPLFSSVALSVLSALCVRLCP